MRTARTKTILLVAAIVLALGGVSAVGVALANQEPAPPVAADLPAESAAPAPSASASSTPSHSPSSSTVSGSSAKPTSRPTPRVDPNKRELAESVPTRIQIPSIKVDASMVDVGLKGDGEMDTPDADPEQAGWFTGAHTPGSPGTSIVVGHVTWNREPTVFFKLGDLERGDQITVTRKDGSKATFAVSKRSTFPKDEFPTKEIFQQATDPELTLITCGGRYDTSTHTYGSNVIVWTKLVKTQPA